MNVFSLLFIILMLAITAILTYFNIETVSVTLWKGYVYELPKIGLILIPFGFGAFLVFFTYLVRDARRAIEGWKDARLKKKEARIQDLYSKGANAALAGQFNDAGDFFTKLLQEEPGHSYALMRMGEISLQAGNVEAAVAYYKKARDADPRNLEILFGLASGFREAGRHEEAMGVYDNILSIDEDNLAALVGKREIHESLDRWEEVNEIQRRILKLQSNSREKEIEQAKFLGFRYELGRFNLEGGQLDKAVKHFKAIIKLDKDFVPAYLGEAEALLRQDQTDKAVEVLEKGYAETGDLTILIRLEDLFLNLGDPNRIIGLYQKAVAADPSNLSLQFFLGKLYYRLEMLDDAFDVLSRMDTLGDHHPHLHKVLGNIYQRRGNQQQAAEEYKKAMRWNKRLMVPYTCNVCNARSNDWSGRCGKCRNWDTYSLGLAYKAREEDAAVA